MDITAVATNALSLSTGLLMALLYDAAVSRPLRKRRHAKKQLTLLTRLLQDSFDIHQQQTRLCDLLVNTLIEHHPARLQQIQAEGYNAAFSGMYGEMTPHQRELLVMIRSLTEQGLYRLNTHLLEWVLENPMKTLFSQGRIRRPELQKMLAALKEMQLHLQRWQAEYQQNFVNDPRQGLVFVGEAEVEGNRFPQALKPAVEAVLKWY